MKQKTENQYSHSKPSSVKRFVSVACIAISLTLLALTIGSDAYFRENRPAEPQPSQGRLYATKLSKGIWVYLTRKEQMVYRLLMPSGAVLIVIGLFLNLWWEQFPIRNISKRLRE